MTSPTEPTRIDAPQSSEEVVERVEYAEVFEPTLFEHPIGHSLDEWRANVGKTELYHRGDTVLVWVNEGDLHDGLFVKRYKRAAIAALPSTGIDELVEVIAAFADAAEKCAGAPHFIVQPFLGVYRKHGETIRAALAKHRQP